MVRSGWYFTSGIANMFIILILIVIAFAYILKIETFQAKKALPKLIIVALLINFSLLFVGMLVDISNIFFQAILKDNQDLPFEVLKTTGGGFYTILLELAFTITTLTICFMTPIASVLCQSGVVFATVSLVFFPNVAQYFFHIFGFLLISSMFFIYAFLFGARVFVVELLAILSPIAFICYILPQTRKFWDEWLKHLIEWLVLGIILFFFLVIGLRAAKIIMPPEAVMIIPIFAWFQLSDFFRYYFFLFVYLVIALWLSKRFTPEIGKVLIEQGKSFGGFFWERGVKPIGERFAKSLREYAASQAEKERAELEKIGKKWDELKLGEQMKIMGVKGAIARPIKWAYRAVGVTPELVVTKDIERMAADFEKRFGKNIDSAIAVNTYRGKLILPRGARAAFGLYLAKMKGAAGINKLGIEEQRKAVEAIAATTPKKLEDFVKHKPELIDDEKVGETIRRTMVSKEMEDPDVKKLIEIGVSEAEAIRKAAFKKAIDAMKVADIENLAISTIENPDFQEMVVRFKDVNFIRRIGEEKGMEYIEAIREKARELGAKEVAKTNLTLLRQSVVNPGFRAIFEPIEGAKTPEDIEKLGEEIREGIKRKRPPTTPPPKFFLEDL
jgi:hypothetical protein